MKSLLVVLAALVVVFVTCGASAHPVGVSRGEYRADARGLALELTLAAPELAPLATSPASDPARAVVERIGVSSAGERCPGTLARATRLERDGVHIEARYACRAPGSREVDWTELLSGLAPGHRHEAKLFNGVEATTALVFSAAPTFVATASTPPASAPFGEFTSFARMGVEHILMGFDHLVFLLGLVIVGLGTRRTLLVVTAFTVAHSLTLAAAALGLWSPPSQLVEPAIALSVAYVGLENLFAVGERHRAAIAFAFGLVHGFGFAGALTEIDYRQGELLLRLAGFNLGVELGQLAVLALLLPLVAALRAHATVERYAAAAVNLAVFGLGLTWFGQRIATL